MPAILAAALALLVFAAAAEAAPKAKPARTSSTSSSVKKSADLDASLAAVDAAAAEERSKTRELFEQEKSEIARVQSDRSKTEDEKKTELRRIKKSFVEKRNAVRLAVRMQFRKRYLESGNDGSRAGGSR